MALLQDYYCDAVLGNDTTGDGTIGTPFATAQKCEDTIGAEAANDLVTATSGVVTIHLIDGDVGDITLSGITDNVSNYIRVLGQTHATKVQWDTSLAFISTVGEGIDNALNNTLIEHVQVEMQNSSATTGIQNSGIASTVNACFVKGPDDATVNNLVGFRGANTSGTVNWFNCIAIGVESSTGYNYGFRQATAGIGNFYNCAGHFSNTSSGFIWAFRRTSGTMNLTNCYGFADNPFHGTTTLVTSAANDSDGTSANLDNILSTIANFVDPNNATTESRDFTLVSGTKIEDGTESTDLSGMFTTDFFDNTISVWPIGPAAIISGGSAAITTQGIGQTQSITEPTLSTIESTLLVNGLQQISSIENSSVVQHNILIAEGVNQNQLLEQTFLTQAHIMAVNPLAQNQSVDNVSLVQANVLNVDNSVQNQFLSNSTLSQGHDLLVDGIAQSNSIENALLTIAASLAVQQLAQTQSLDNAGLSQHHILAVDGVGQSNIIDSTLLSVLGQLAPEGLTQTQAIELTTLAQHNFLAIDAISQTQTLENSLLDISANLSVVGLSQAQTVELSNISLISALSVDLLTQSQITEIVKFGGAIIGFMKGEIVICSAINGEVTVSKLINGSITIH